ncbi:hypothetical protein [Pseudaestuariivita atlantica]|uniref:Uncharacterized protein n=1 Tax=Pseudaestuariivita atlantica TaxID=1317121 RepID=A0A0L1JLE1_9RHOB|nr:hypothetical protein [Pseudaestuariivita atlantica]KNG92532.1 hypothetical protein ATO11_15985 [Pseudaestuariivita atlantica]
MKNGWHILRDGARLTLSRRLPVRFDIAAETTLPHMRPVPLAHMIRQDVWRCLQHLRGFAPVVVVDRRATDMLISTGGRIDGARATARDRLRLQDALADPATRARWIRCAT